MTYYVSSGTLNSTNSHTLTQLNSIIIIIILDSVYSAVM